MLPIEAGCLAIIINANFTGNLGKVVKVLNFEHMETLKMGNPVWFIESINGPIVIRTDDDTMNSVESKTGLILQRNLMRIGGGSDKDFLDKRINFLEIK